MTLRTMICLVLFFPLFVTQSRLWEQTRGRRDFSRRQAGGDKTMSVLLMLVTVFELWMFSTFVLARFKL